METALWIGIANAETKFQTKLGDHLLILSDLLCSRSTPVVSISPSNKKWSNFNGSGKDDCSENGISPQSTTPALSSKASRSPSNPLSPSPSAAARLLLLHWDDVPLSGSAEVSTSAGKCPVLDLEGELLQFEETSRLSSSQALLSPDAAANDYVLWAGRLNLFRGINKQGQISDMRSNRSSNSIPDSVACCTDDICKAIVEAHVHSLVERRILDITQNR